MEKILVIEDESAVRDNIAEILELAQYEVITAADGVKGLELIRQQTPDLIICDVMMPQMDGFEVLETLQSDPDLAAIPLILLTAMADLQNLREGMDLGADDYLTKPFDLNELLISVSSRLRKRNFINQQIEKEKIHVKSLNNLVKTQIKTVYEIEKSLTIKDKFIAKLIEKHQGLIVELENTLANLRQHPQSSEYGNLLIPLETHLQQQKKLFDEAIAIQQLLNQSNVELLQSYGLL
ncbi:MAG: response regulator [Synechocystis sp.]|nr:response regulator [Synechocystis sp.]